MTRKVDRRKFLQGAALGAAGLSGAALLQACGVAPETSTQVPVASQAAASVSAVTTGDVVLSMAASDLTSWVRVIVDNFNASNQGFKVNLKLFEGDVVEYLYQEETFRKILATDNPDVVWYSSLGPSFDKLVSEGMLEPLNSLYQQEGWDNVLPEAMPRLVTQPDGNRYAVNDSMQWAPVIYYRKDAFQKANIEVPKERYFGSMDEFYAACDKLRAAGYEPLSIGSKDGFIVHTLQALLQRVSTTDQMHDLVTNWRKGSTPTTRYTDEPWIKALERYQEMNQKQVFAPGFVDRYVAEARALFIQGKAAMYQDGQWAASKSTLYGEAPDLEFDWMIYPQIDPAIKPKYLIYAGTGLMVRREAKNVEGAKKFLSFFMQKEQIESAMQKTQTDLPIPPARMDVALDTIRQQSAHTADMLESLRVTGTDNGWGIQEPGDMSERCAQLLQEFLSGQIDARKVGEEMEKVAEKHRTAA